MNPNDQAEFSARWVEVERAIDDYHNGLLPGPELRRVLAERRDIAAHSDDTWAATVEVLAEVARDEAWDAVRYRLMSTPQMVAETGMSYEALRKIAVANRQLALRIGRDYVWLPGAAEVVNQRRRRGRPSATQPSAEAVAP